MNRINRMLLRLDGVGSSDLRYVRTILEIALELGYFPKDIYARAARRLHIYLGALRKGLSRLTPLLWESGGGVFHKPGTPCPKPMTVLRKMAYILSDGTII